MSLFNEVVKKSGRLGNNSFWDSPQGNFSALNYIDKKNLSPATLRQIQLGILMKQNASNSRLREANNFIKNLPTYRMEDTEELAANQIFTMISQILNSPFKSGSAQIRNMSNRANELNRLLKTINVNIPIPSSVLSALNSNEVIKDAAFYEYRKEKAALFENIAAAYINGLGGQAITTGSWGKISERNAQLVTDVFAFVNKPETVLSGSYTPYKKTGYWKADMARAKNGIAVSVQNEPIGDFISRMEKLNGNGSIGISIDDELATTLDTVSSLRVQVKSGMNQSLLNANMRNAISLNQIDDGGYLNLLLDLYKLDERQNFVYLYKNPKDSPILTAYGNYLLSKNIAKTSVVQSNDIYFTEHGFETAYGWLKNKNFYLRFSKNIKLNASLLSQNRPYEFSAV